MCTCVISPKTLPREGDNFCDLFERHANTVNGDICSGSSITSNKTDFTNETPDMVLRNGLKIYNIHNDAGPIDALANNTQGGTYGEISNTNSYGYTVYVDIDGDNGPSQKWVDVFPFYLTLSGKIIPAYDTSSGTDGNGGNNKRYLQVSVENEYYEDGKRKMRWLAISVPFKEGACKSGYVGSGTPYCSGISKLPECSANNSSCRLRQISPAKFFL